MTNHRPKHRPKHRERTSSGDLGREPSWSSLVDLLQCRADEQPDDHAYTFLDEGEVEGARWTWSELDRKARTVAAWLQGRVTPGDRALLMYPPGLEFIAAFFGCLYAGVVAVPVQPPQKGRAQRGLDRVQAIAASADPAAILTAGDEHSARRTPHSALGVTDTLDHHLYEHWQPPTVGPETLAFLQFTSGSTSSPKGVMVTHANLLHNLMYGFHVGGTGRHSVSVSWLPVTHDMGLIEGVLQPAFSGSPAYLMSPSSFLQRPARWLNAISDHRAVRSGGPNFAYDLAVGRVSAADRARLDLSCWKAAYNGAEPVRADTMAAFAAAYRGAGFRASAFRPCYGLAEGTLLVSSEPWHEASSDAHVSCGRPAFGTQVVITDPGSGDECGDGELGEIRVAGPSVTCGYWNDAEETRRVFVTRPGSDQRWLRTGDLGFRRNGRLYVTGRLKDLLIVRGAKHFPQDVERTAEGVHPAIRRGAVTAVAVGAGVRGDHIVVIAETDPRDFAGHANASELIAAVREAIAEAHGIQLHAVALVAPGVVPKTTSGKPRRYLCRDAWIKGTLQPIAAWSEAARQVVLARQP